MSTSSSGDSRPGLTSSGSGSSNCAPSSPHLGQRTLHLVSTTSPNPSSRGSSPAPVDGDRRDQLGGSPTSSYSSGDYSSDGVVSDWQRWMKAYSAGSWRGDTAPYPPPAINAVLQVAGDLVDVPRAAPRLPSPSLPPPTSSNHIRAPDFTIYPESASSRSSNGSIHSTSQDQQDVMDHFKRNRYLKAPRSEYEEDRLRTMKRYNLDDPTRRAAIDRVCSFYSAGLK